MSEPQPISPEPGRWKRPAYLLVVLAALALVMFVWFHPRGRGGVGQRRGWVHHAPMRQRRSIEVGATHRAPGPGTLW